MNKKEMFAWMLFCFSGMLMAQNVGIGVATPLEKLHVSAWIRSDSLDGADSCIVIADQLGTLRRFPHPDDPAQVLLGDLTWGPPPGGGGSGGDFYFPDGFSGYTPVTLSGASDFPYNVPAGMNLYILNAHNNVGNTTSSLEVNGITVMIGFTNRGEQDDAGALQRPIILSPGDQVTGKTTTTINGFLIPQTVTAVTVDVQAGSYVVPAGKTLLITSYCSNGGFGRFLYVDGKPVFEAYSLFRGEAARNSHLDQAIFVGAGSTVSANHLVGQVASINGYLR